MNAYLDGLTPLIVAATSTEDPEVVTTLLKAGANIEARDLQYGVAALMWAAAHNPNPEVITTLLKAGADAKAKSTEGKTAFYYAQLNLKLIDTDGYRNLREASK